MTARRCVCGHLLALHRANTSIGGRNECWAASVTPGQRWCNCRQFLAAHCPEGVEDE